MEAMVIIQGGAGLVERQLYPQNHSLVPTTQLQYMVNIWLIFRYQFDTEQVADTMLMQK